MSTASDTDHTDDTTILDQAALYVTVGAGVLVGVCTLWLMVDEGSSFATSAQTFFVWVAMAGGVVMGLLYLRRLLARRAAKS